MALSTKAMQKKREKKKSKRKRTLKKLTSIVTQRNAWALYECRMGDDIWADGEGHVIVAKVNEYGEYQVGFFLVDVLCLGVKDVFISYMARDEYETALKQVTEDLGPHAKIEPGYAAKLIYDSVAYSQSLGLKTTSTFASSKKILRGITPDDTLSFTFGRDGKPVYIPGPDDTQKTS